VGVSSYYGTGMAGSVDMLFSDIVGDYQLYSSLAINGQPYDFGGAVTFMNNRNRINWGLAFSHIPYKYNYYETPNRDSIKNSDTTYYPVIKYPLSTLTIFEDAFTLFAIKALSQSQRVEAFGSYSYYSYRLDRITYYYDTTGSFIDYSREKNLPTVHGFGMGAFGTAYTLDNAYMGIASPLRGQRFRFEVQHYFGDINFNSLLIDFRKYFFLNPLCIAARLYHYGRYGSMPTSQSTKNVIQSLYIGWPWLVRGFGYEYIDKLAKANDTDKINQLFGSRIAVANLELRIPFTGPARLCLIPFKYFISELSFFADGGIAWDSRRKPAFKTKDYSKYSTPVGSYGVSLRVNFFGVMVLEPYYAIPMQRNASDYAGLSLNFLPGW
jgi:outer membrane protein assembly factor BamA